MGEAFKSLLQGDSLHFEFVLPDREKRFKELTLYIAHSCLDDPRFSLTGLYKTLFYSDFEAYGRYGKPITGVPYQKLPRGPVPKAAKRILADMETEGLIRVAQRKVYDFSRDRVVPLRDPNCDQFLAREISLVDSWIRSFWNKTASEISLFSHGKAWQIAGDRELIPYEAVFISDEPITYDDAARFKELAAQHNWKL